MSITAEANPTWQKLMDAGHDKWTAGKKYDEVLFSLTGPEKIAMLLGHLNYQVGNGGHRQWVDNGYALQGRDVLNALKVVMDDEGTTAEEKEVLQKQWDNIGALLSFVDPTVKDRGFMNDYWLKDSRRDSRGYGWNDDGGEDRFEDEYNEGAEFADTLDSWYDEVYEKVAGPAIERFLVKATS